MRDSDSVARERRALGCELAAYRRAAGHSQAALTGRIVAASPAALGSPSDVMVAALANLDNGRTAEWPHYWPSDRICTPCSRLSPGTWVVGA